MAGRSCQPRKRCMEGQEEKRHLPKRERVPPKKISFYEPHSLSPKENQDGLFVFLTFEDGYTANIFKACDIQSKNEKTVQSFEALYPGDEVLARWSDNKFYNATVEYVGNTDAKKGAKKEFTKKKGAAANKFFNHPSSCPSRPEHKPPLQHSLSSPLSPPSLQQPSSPCQPVYSPLHHKPPVLHQPSPLQPPSHQTSSLQPPAHQPCSLQPPALQRSSPQPPLLPLDPYLSPSSQRVYSPVFHHRAVLNQTPALHKPPLHELPASHQEYSSPVHQSSPVLVSLDQRWNQPTPVHQTAKESFLNMLYTPPGTGEHQDSSSVSASTSRSSADTLIIDCSPIQEYGEPCESSESCEDQAWRPCKKCEVEVAKLRLKNGKLEEVLQTISGNQIEAMRSFLDKLDQILARTNVMATKHNSRKQELYPESGLLISPTSLAAIHAEARKDCLRLFHLLFDEFFSPEECKNAVAFGKHGKVPEGKTVLDKSKVEGILTYIMHCSALAGWTAVEKAKVKKALINKCRMRAAKTVE